MRSLPFSLGRPFETRVAARTFLLFAICAAIPIVSFAWLGYQTVSQELRSHASKRLIGASKSYGLLIFERLRDAEENLSFWAHRELQLADPHTSDVARIRHGGVQIMRVDRQAIGSASRHPPARQLRMIEVAGERLVEITVLAQGDRQRVAVTGVLSSAALWNSDAINLESARLCVVSESAVLHCTRNDDDQGTESDVDEADAGTTVAGEWVLYLRPWFGASDWTIRAEQPKHVAYASLLGFTSDLPIVFALALICALLLSAIQIRRSHQPLMVLTQAAARIGKLRFNRPVQVGGNDEYAGLAAAFNGMSTTLRAQFSLLSTLSRVDRLILAHDSSSRVLAALLPKLPRLLHCDTATVVLIDAQRGLTSCISRPAHAEDLPAHCNLSVEQVQLLAQDQSMRSTTDIPFDLQELFATAVTRFICAPIRLGSELRGVLVLGYQATRSGPSATRNASGVARRIAVSIRNEEREQMLLRQAYYDDLTHLPNRALFKERLGQELLRCREGQDCGALMFIDVDRFKNVNDSLGHSVGDELLEHLAERFARSCRPGDTLARLGGDEFALLAPGAGKTEALRIAADILSGLRVPLRLHEINYVAAASIGITMYPNDGSSTETLLRNADLAMYRAKASRRGHAQFFEQHMNEEAARLLTVEHELRAALQNHELSLHFQPIVCSRTGMTVGIEALARWFKSDGTSVSPAVFIPVAEETGLIGRLGAWALREACESLARCRQSGLSLEYVAVNVSSRQLNDPLFADSVEQCLSQTGLRPGCLEIEITESVLVDNIDLVRDQLQRLRKLGIRIAIDDFGTGYSSMALLRELPFDTLKIDQCFVRDCDTSEEARAIVRALVTVGHALKKTIVVEGVERDGQRQVIADLECQRMQGYLFGKPRPEGQLTRTGG